MLCSVSTRRLRQVLLGVSRCFVNSSFSVATAATHGSLKGSTGWAVCPRIKEQDLQVGLPFIRYNWEVRFAPPEWIKSYRCSIGTTSSWCWCSICLNNCRLKKFYFGLQSQIKHWKLWENYFFVPLWGDTRLIWGIFCLFGILGINSYLGLIIYWDMCIILLLLLNKKSQLRTGPVC